MSTLTDIKFEKLSNFSSLLEIPKDSKDFILAKIPLFSITFLLGNHFVACGGGGSISSGIPNAIIFGKFSNSDTKKKNRNYFSEFSVFNLGEKMPLKVITNPKNRLLIFSCGDFICYAPFNKIIPIDPKTKNSFVEDLKCKSQKLEIENSDFSLKHLCVSPDGMRLAVGSGEKSISIFNLSTFSKGRVTYEGRILTKNKFSNFSYDSSGNFICVAFNKEYISLYSGISPHEEVAKFRTDLDFNVHCAFIQKSSLKSSLENFYFIQVPKNGDRSNKIIISKSTSTYTDENLAYQNENLKVISKIVLKKKAFVTSVSESHSFIYLSDSNGEIFIFEKNGDSKALNHLRTPHQLPVKGIAVNSQQNLILTAGADGKIWGASFGKRMGGTLKVKNIFKIMVYFAPVIAVFYYFVLKK